MIEHIVWSLVGVQIIVSAPIYTPVLPPLLAEKEAPQVESRWPARVWKGRQQKHPAGHEHNQGWV